MGRVAPVTPPRERCGRDVQSAEVERIFVLVSVCTEDREDEGLGSINQARQVRLGNATSDLSKPPHITSQEDI